MFYTGSVDVFLQYNADLALASVFFKEKWPKSSTNINIPHDTEGSNSTVTQETG